RPLPTFGPGSAQAAIASGVGVKRVELGFRQRVVEPSELYRDIVKPAGAEAAIEVPQSRNDHPDDRDLDIGPRLVEDEEIQARTLGDLHAGHHLLAPVETAELRAEVRSDRRTAIRRQVGMLRQVERTRAVIAPRIAGSHETDGQKLVQ